MMDPVSSSSSSSSMTQANSSLLGDENWRVFSRGITLKSLQNSIPDIIIRHDITAIGRNPSLANAYIDTPFLSNLHCVLVLFHPRDPRRVHAVHTTSSLSSSLPPLSDSYVLSAVINPTSTMYKNTTGDGATVPTVSTTLPPEYIGILHDLSSNGTWVNNVIVQGCASDRYFDSMQEFYLKRKKETFLRLRRTTTTTVKNTNESNHVHVTSHSHNSSVESDVSIVSDEDQKFLEIVKRINENHERSIPVKYGDIIELTRTAANTKLTSTGRDKNTKNNYGSNNNNNELIAIRFQIQYTNPSDTTVVLQPSPVSVSPFAFTKSFSSNRYPSHDLYRRFNLVSSITPTRVLRLKGQFYQDYLVSKLLGEGTYGAVYEVISIVTGEYFACKVVYPKNMQIIGAGGGRTDYPALLEEIEILQSVRHPNVVSYFDLYKEKTIDIETIAKGSTTPGTTVQKVPRKDPTKENTSNETEDIIFIIMEYVSNGEVFDKIQKKHRFPEKQGRDIYKQLLKGIAYLHSRGICHRDLKPENLLLHSYYCDRKMIETTPVPHNRYILKITDFGMSRIITRTYIAPSNGTIVSVGSHNHNINDDDDEKTHNRINDDERIIYQPIKDKKFIAANTITESSSSTVTERATDTTTNDKVAVTAQKKLTRAKSIVGTADYIPPEVYLRWKSNEMNRRLITYHNPETNEIIRRYESDTRRLVRIHTVRKKLQQLGQQYPFLFNIPARYPDTHSPQEPLQYTPHQPYIETYSSSSSSTQGGSEEFLAYSSHTGRKSSRNFSSSSVVSSIPVNEQYLDEWSTVMLEQAQTKDNPVDFDSNTQLPDIEPTTVVTLSSSSSTPFSSSPGETDQTWKKDKHVLHCKTVDLVREYLPNNVVDYADSKEMELYFQRIGYSSAYYELLQRNGSTEPPLITSPPERMQTLINPYSVTWAQTNLEQIESLAVLDDYVKYGYNGFSMDSWSLGVILYILLTGTPMFPEMSADNGYNPSSTNPIDAQNIPSVLQRMLLRYVDFPSFTVPADENNTSSSSSSSSADTTNGSRTIDLSKDSIDLILSLCHLNPKQRLTPFQALSHPWILNVPLSSTNHPRMLPKYPNKYGTTGEEKRIESERRRMSNSSSVNLIDTKEISGGTDKPNPINHPLSPNFIHQGAELSSLSSTAEVDEEENSLVVNPFQFCLPLKSNDDPDHHPDQRLAKKRAYEN